MSKEEQFPLSKVSPEDTKVELSCKSATPILLYFEEKYGRQKLASFVTSTKMNLDYLEDKDNWMSYNYWCRLLAKLVEYTGNPKAPFEAGLYTTKRQSYGALETFCSRFGTPSTAYRMMSQIVSRYNKIATLKVVNLKKNSCNIIAYYLKGYTQDKNNCLNVQGDFASVPVLWNLPLAKIKEVQCAAEGADSCVYEISWQNKPTHFFGLLGLFTGLIIAYMIRLFLGMTEGVVAFIFIPVLGYLTGRLRDQKAILKDRIAVNERESRELIESVETIEKLNIELQGKVEQRTRELQNALDELKKSQNQLVQSEKMASVGRLAAGMAHELNNPVGAIRNYIQDVLEDIPEKSPFKERLKSAENATSRCKRIVSDLLTFARESKDLKSADVNSIVEAAVKNAQEEISNSGVKISKELAKDLSPVEVDSMQIQQVFMNMIMNAADAVKGKGQITIKTHSSSGNILIEISDTGEGIPEDVQDKIFDPFVTTKAPGKGTGLGLAISYNIIKRFGGDIRVDSKKGKGTTFTVTLPVVDKTAGKA